MNIEDLKENLMDRWQTLWEKISESSSYIQLKERYESCSLRTQKLIIIGTTSLVVLLILSVPISFFRASAQSEDSFEEKNELIVDLLKNSGKGGGTSNKVMSFSSLKINAKSVLTAARLLPEQIKGIQKTTSETKRSPLIPSSLTQESLRVSLVKINLKQIVEIGTALSNMHRFVKLKDMNISPNKEDKKYSDATYTLVSIGLPEKVIEPKPSRSSKSRSRSKSRSKSKRSRLRGRN